ncbi:restriction endonuclease subunit S [Clostridium taeniosporum]|uniref:Restriction endonuclease subunit S n=1 Tax=Clostridium taeniosporum TaxID=394958 RepID=A0A1D7XLC3_9CLOT|nr:restriction endonuclease subunit S [Clostridium taeniosporum]AOR24142.1 restriction endonuclease subunit S [Clostridium taeniosporum]
MNNELRPYREYKKVDLLWIDKIPKQWKVVGNRTLWAERKTQNCIDEELFSVTIKKGIIKQSDLLKNTSKKDSSNLDKSKYKLVLPRDIAYNKMRMWQGAVGSSKYKGIVSPAYIVLKPISELNPNYYHYLMRTPDYIEESHRYSYGMCDDQLNLRYEDFKQMKIIKPPLDEQDQIVKYLDFQLAKINKFIQSKKKLIEALKEQIECYVFGNEDKTLVDEIKSWDTAFPKEWLFIKSSRLTKEISIKNNVGSELLAVTQDRGVVYKRDCEQNYVSPAGDLSALKLVRNGDFVISLRSFQGGIEFSEIEGIVSPAYNVFCLRKEYSSYEYKMYYKYLFKTKIFISVLNTLVSGIRDGKNINYSDFAKILLPIPPKKTVIKIRKLIEKYERIKNQFENERILLEEFKNSLISDVVTGKVDVRHIKIDNIIEEDIEIDEIEDEEIDTEEVLDSEE